MMRKCPPDALRLPAGELGRRFEFPLRVGIASAIAPFAESIEELAGARCHAALFDFDGDRRERVEDALALAVMRYRLPDFAVYRSGSRGGYHAIALCARPLAEVHQVGAFVRSDAKHRRAGRRYGFNVLRRGPKTRPDGSIEVSAPRLVSRIRSPYPAEARAEWLRLVEFSAVVR